MEEVRPGRFPDPAPGLPPVPAAALSMGPPPTSEPGSFRGPPGSGCRPCGPRSPSLPASPDFRRPAFRERRPLPAHGNAGAAGRQDAASGRRLPGNRLLTPGPLQGSGHPVDPAVDGTVTGTDPCGVGSFRGDPSWLSSLTGAARGVTFAPGARVPVQREEAAPEGSVMHALPPDRDLAQAAPERLPMVAQRFHPGAAVPAGGCRQPPAGLLRQGPQADGAARPVTQRRPGPATAPQTSAGSFPDSPPNSGTTPS